MKILASILSVYFLVLAVIPCSDAGLSSTSENQNLVQVEHGSHQENPGDACPPFCTCQCCQSHLTIIDFPVIDSINPEFKIAPTFHKNNVGKEFFTSLFQPPRA
jgi:hypothetical protein